MIAIIGIHLLSCWTMMNGQKSSFPANHWQKYANIREAGFSKEPLDSLQHLLQSSNTAALLVIHDGKILLEYGATTRRFPQTSIRKSYLSALFGKYKIDLNQTLDQLGINDLTPLTAAEKQARIIDLLAARSGIYLPSAYSPESMEKRLPARGSHAPGTFWFYNNWDFNVLNTIFQKETNQDFFQAFAADIATPIQMEDFRMSDTYYRYEKDKSQHPAYLFKFSARDMARFGLLYLNKGKWGKKQLLSSEWIQQSTNVYTADLGVDFANRGSYGLLWWIAKPPLPTPMYYASGLGGQRIYILPESNLVVVHLTDTYQNKGVSEEHLEKILQLLLQAKTGTSMRKPHVMEYIIETPPIQSVKVDTAVLSQFSGVYQHRFLGDLKVTVDRENLRLELGLGYFRLLPTGNNLFWVEDIDIPCEFINSNGEKKGQVVSEMNEKRELKKVTFYY